MWAQYKKTFLRIQSVILVVTCAVFFAAEHRLAASGAFFLMMQIGAVLGAVWAVRLKHRVELYR